MNRKSILGLLLFFGFFLVAGLSSSYAQDDGGKRGKKSKKGMGTQEDVDQDVKDGQERQMSKEDKKNLQKKKKEVAAKRKKDEITRKRADKIAKKRLDKVKKDTARKKKNYVKTHGGR